MMLSVFISVCVLICLGAILHLAWGLFRAALIWAPSGYAGIVAGWCIAELSSNAALGVAAALSVSTLVRFAIVRAWTRCFAPRVILAAWAEEP